MNQKSTIIIAVAVVVVLAAAGVGAFFLMKDKDKDNDETYYYYLYFGDANAKNGWYSAKADNASDGFINAMKDANLEWKQSKLGYVATIDGVGTSWKIFNYVFSHTDKAAQDGSSTAYLNGWLSLSGYATEEHDGFKLFQSNAKIWFLTPYKEDSSFEDPSTVSTWKNAGPFEKDIFDDSDKTFWFYLYFAEGNAKNGWYSAKASNASDAFTAAMKDANIEWTKSNIGYVQSIDGNDGSGNGWSLMTYLYSQTDKAAQDASATKSGFDFKGWGMLNGYDTEAHDGFKLFESSATIWFMAPYAAVWTDTPDPSTASSWKATGPFDA